MAVTHSDDASQRLVDLPIVRHEGRHADVCHVRVSVPDNCNLLPPGWYLLFVVDGAGVPSVGEWVHVGPAPRRPGP